VPITQMAPVPQLDGLVRSRARVVKRHQEGEG
jgi:hypothetical protein